MYFNMLASIKKFIKFIPFLFLFNCAVNHQFHPTGNIDLVKKNYEKNDGKNRVYIMEEPAKWTNSWHFGGNNYYADGKYITRLIYGMSYVYETTKNKVKIALATIYGGGGDGKGSIMETNKLEDNRYGGRYFDVDFNKEKNVYLVSYTNYNNFDAGGSLLGAVLFDRKLKKQGEPFKFRKVSKNVWWNMHNDPDKKRFYLKNVKESDLIKAREVQGLK